MLIFYNNSCQPCVKHLLFFYVSNYFRYAANSYKWSFLRCLSCLSCHVMSRDKSLMEGQVYCREPRLIYTHTVNYQPRCIVETPDKYTCRLPRCIVESPDTSGNGVDFCRLPVDCASVCSQAGTRRIVMAAKIGFYHNHVNILTENRFVPC